MSNTAAGGLLLAGGQARRMGGGDKCLLELGGRQMMAHAIERLRPQAAPLVISANGDPRRFATFGLPVVADVVPGFAGPLAGILSGMAWLREAAPRVEWLATAATDSPFFPRDLVVQLLAAALDERAEVVFAASDGRTHPVFALWHLSLREELARAMSQENERKIDRFAERHRVTTVSFPNEGLDPFFNINRPEDLAEAAQLLEVVEESSQSK
jgi:molybdopterin-guanine dinucleotide biosynthesis protein A